MHTGVIHVSTLQSQQPQSNHRLVDAAAARADGDDDADAN